MSLFLHISGAVLLAVILGLTLNSYCKEIGIILAITVCCLTALAALNYLEPILGFLKELEALGRLDGTMLEILMKAPGFGIVTEIANMVCKDAGNESMGKSMQLLGSAVILYLSMPLFLVLIDLLQKILGEL